MTENKELQSPQTGELAAVSQWFVVDQDMFTQFEKLTLSNDPLHTDPEWVTKHTPYKSTIAPGFLSMSLLPYLAEDAQLVRDGSIGVNYGFNRLRWPEPVPVNSKVRAKFYKGSRDEKLDNTVGSVAEYAVVLEIEGNDRPGMIANWLIALLPAPSEE